MRGRTREGADRDDGIVEDGLIANSAAREGEGTEPLHHATVAEMPVQFLTVETAKNGPRGTTKAAFSTQAARSWIVTRWTRLFRSWRRSEARVLRADGPRPWATRHGHDRQV